MQAKVTAKIVIINTNFIDGNVKELPTEVMKNGDIESNGKL